MTGFAIDAANDLNNDCDVYLRDLTRGHDRRWSAA